MSFNSSKKPKLVETKLSKYYINKLHKQKNIQEQLNKEIELVIPAEDSLYKKIINYLYDCIIYIYIYTRQSIINNYGFIFIISLLIILLYVRYIEVDNRKIKMQKIINKIKDDDSSDSSDSI